MAPKTGVPGSPPGLPDIGIDRTLHLTSNIAVVDLASAGIAEGQLDRAVAKESTVITTSSLTLGNISCAAAVTFSRAWRRLDDAPHSEGMRYARVAT